MMKRCSKSAGSRSNPWESKRSKLKAQEQKESTPNPELAEDNSLPPCGTCMSSDCSKLRHIRPKTSPLSKRTTRHDPSRENVTNEDEPRSVVQMLSPQGVTSAVQRCRAPHLRGHPSLLVVPRGRGDADDFITGEGQGWGAALRGDAGAASHAVRGHLGDRGEAFAVGANEDDAGSGAGTGASGQGGTKAEF